ncbi:MAG: DUF3080 family protein [Amphritea sp.]
MRKICLNLFLTLTLLNTGCSESTPESRLENYAQRVATTLDQDSDLNLNQPLSIPLLPRRRERLLKAEEIRQGLLEVLNLRHCELLPLIAERNSSLGRIMRPSQQLIYEMKLYNGLRDCQQNLPAMELEAEVIEQIREIWAIKQRNLPIVLWNSIYNNEEMERNFSLSEPSLPLSGEDTFSGTMTALKHFNILASLASNHAQWALPEFIDQLEQDYLTLYSNRYGSRWIRSIYQLTRTLNHTAQIIENRLQKRPLCFNRQPNPQAQIIKNVFHKYYAGEVQPYMAMLDNQGRRWLTAQAELLNHFTALMPAVMRDYQLKVLSLKNPRALWPQYVAARNRHTRAWQELLSQCNLMPGSDTAK